MGGTHGRCVPGKTGTFGGARRFALDHDVFVNFHIRHGRILLTQTAFVTALASAK